MSRVIRDDWFGDDWFGDDWLGDDDRGCCSVRGDDASGDNSDESVGNGEGDEDDDGGDHDDCVVGGEHDGGEHDGGEHDDADGGNDGVSGEGKEVITSKHAISRAHNICLIFE